MFTINSHPVGKTARDELKERVLSRFSSNPMRQALAETALNGLFAGLDQLAQLGHPLQLVGLEAAVVEYPKMLYRGVEQLTVFSAEEEEQAEAEGWKSQLAAKPPVVKPTEAKLAKPSEAKAK